MPLGYPKLEVEDGKKKFVFRIPKFDQNVMIDPSINVGKVNGAVSWGQVNVGLALLLQFAVVFAVHFI